jgi:hypothetical protein
LTKEARLLSGTVVTSRRSTIADCRRRL